MDCRLVKTLFLLQLLVNNCAESFTTEREVDFLLRVRDWPAKNEEFFRLENKEAVLTSSFDPSKTTTIQIHGYLEDGATSRHQQLSSALLEIEDQNLFFVDWGSTRKSFWYPDAVERVPSVAKIVSEFISFLNENASLKLEDTTIIGFSLGAHISGLAGKGLKNGKVGKIIGLDPAGPNFSYAHPSGRLNLDDATYVECLHTGFIFGILDPICKTDFYVNGGRNQPGCEGFLGADNVICSHCRAIEVFIESLYTPKAFFGQRCESATEALDKNCNGEHGAYINDKENELKGLSGIFHVSTHSEAPYGKSLVAEF